MLKNNQSLVWGCIGKEHSCPNLFIMRKINTGKNLIFPYFLESWQLPCMLISLLPILWLKCNHGNHSLLVAKCFDFIGVFCLVPGVRLPQGDVIQNFWRASSSFPLSLLHSQEYTVLPLLIKGLWSSCFFFVRLRCGFLKVILVLLWRW